MGATTLRVDVFKSRNSTTPPVPLKPRQNLNVPSLNRAVKPTTIAITNPFGVLAMGTPVYATKLRRTTMAPKRKLPTQITIQIGDGRVAVGRWQGLTVSAKTQIAICGKSYGPCPAEIAQPIKHAAVVAIVTQQRMQSRRNPRFKRNKINLPLVVISNHLNDAI